MGENGVKFNNKKRKKKKKEILIINVDENTTIIHETLDTLLLNATAVSDFKKTLRKK